MESKTRDIMTFYPKYLSTYSKSCFEIILDRKIEKRDSISISIKRDFKKKLDKIDKKSVYLSNLVNEYLKNFNNISHSTISEIVNNAFTLLEVKTSKIKKFQRLFKKW